MNTADFDLPINITWDPPASSVHESVWNLVFVCIYIEHAFVLQLRTVVIMVCDCTYVHIYIHISF